LGDGFCDDATNTEACNWDGGDCCEESNQDYEFDDGYYCNDCECIDPDPAGWSGPRSDEFDVFHLDWMVNYCSDVGGFPYGDGLPQSTRLRPLWRPNVWTHTPQSCVSGENIKKYECPFCNADESDCCKHDDCGEGSYCHDTEFYRDGKWSGVGSCSAEDTLALCCANKDADPIDRDTANCPAASKCPVSQENPAVVYECKSVDECKLLCLDDPTCMGIEYGVAYGGAGTYGPGDCQLSSSATTEGCEGATHNLDFYTLDTGVCGQAGPPASSSARYPGRSLPSKRHQRFPRGIVPVPTGAAMHEVAGRAVVIHDQNGDRVACALLGEGGSLKATFTRAGTKYPGMPADYPEAVSVSGEVTQFITTSPSRGPLTTFDYHLEGLDPRCADGAGRADNSCGIHVHEGTDCQDKSKVGGHFYQTRSDPWKTVAYTAPCSEEKDACQLPPAGPAIAMFGLQMDCIEECFGESSPDGIGGGHTCVHQLGKEGCCTMAPQCLGCPECVSLAADRSFEGVFYNACDDQGFGTSKLEDLVAGRRAECLCEDGETTHSMCCPADCQDLADRMATCALEPSDDEKKFVKELVRDGKPVKFDCAGLVEHFPDACYNDGGYFLVDDNSVECEVACKQAIMGCDAFVSKAKPDEPWCSAANEEFVLKYAAGMHNAAAEPVDDGWWNFQIEGYGTADDTSESHYSSLSTFLADVRGLCPVSCGVCDADAGGSPRGTAQVQAGLGFTETGANMAAGRCLVVHDYDGARIASAPLRPAHDTTPMEVSPGVPRELDEECDEDRQCLSDLCCDPPCRVLVMGDEPKRICVDYV
jgi:hypothetical protein